MIYGYNPSFEIWLVGRVNHTYDVCASIAIEIISMRIFSRPSLETDLSPIMFRGRVARLGKTLTRFSTNPNCADKVEKIDEG